MGNNNAVQNPVYWLLVGREFEKTRLKNLYFQSSLGEPRIIDKNYVKSFMDKNTVLNATCYGGNLAGKNISLKDLPTYKKVTVQGAYGMQEQAEQVSGKAIDYVVSQAQPLIQEYKNKIINKQREITKRNKNAQRSVKTSNTTQQKTKNYNIEAIKSKLREKGRLEKNGYAYSLFRDLIVLVEIPDEPVIYIEPFVQVVRAGICECISQESLKITGGSGIIDWGELFDDRCKVSTLDLSSLEISDVTDMTYMFGECKIDNLIISKHSNFNPANCTGSIIRNIQYV